jgi:hypothetical protein
MVLYLFFPCFATGFLFCSGFFDSGSALFFQSLPAFVKNGRESLKKAQIP